MTLRHALLGALGANLQVALLYVQLPFAQKPVGQVPIDFIHPLLEFPGGDVAVTGEQGGVLGFFFTVTPARAESTGGCEARHTAN
jgi:hypothetical protein